MLKDYFTKMWFYVAVCLLFTYEASAGWSSPPMLISPPEFTNTIGSSEQQIGISNSGYAVAIWQGSANDVTGDTLVQSATLVRGGTWSPFVQVDRFAGGGDTRPQIAVDPAGNAVAVWVFFDPINNFSVHAATLPFGGQWTPSVQVSSATLTPVMRPQVAVDIHGNAVAVWQTLIGSNTIIQSSSLLFGSQTWSPPINVTQPGSNQQVPQVGVDAAGNAIAVWQNTTTHKIQSATLLFNSSAWSTPVDLSSANATRPQIAVDPQGNAVAVWRLNSIVIQSSSYTFATQSWSPPVNISSSSSSLVDQPTVKVDPKGDAVAIWMASSVAGTFIQSAVLPFQTSWSSPQNASGPFIISQAPSLGLDSLGNATATWYASDPTFGNVIQAAMMTFPTNVWSTPTLISTQFQFNDLGPSTVAVDPTGYAVAIWENNDGEFSIIEGVFFIPANPIAPSTFCGVLNKCHFPYVLKVCWSASTSPGITSYHIFKGGKLIATVPATSPFFFKTCVNSRCAAKQFSITAINSDGIESAPQPIVIQKKCACFM